MDFGNPLVTAIVAVAVLALVVYRQLRERPVGGRAYTLPLVITVVGLVLIVQNPPPVSTVGLVLTAVELLAVAGFGVLRGRSVPIYERDGVLVQRGGGATVALWVLTIGVRIGLGVLAVAVGAGVLAQATLLFSLGVSLLVQAAVVQQRIRPAARISG